MHRQQSRMETHTKVIRVKAVQFPSSVPVYTRITVSLTLVRKQRLRKRRMTFSDAHTNRVEDTGNEQSKNNE